jgi:hypothetical protein
MGRKRNFSNAFTTLARSLLPEFLFWLVASLRVPASKLDRKEAFYAGKRSRRSGKRRFGRRKSPATAAGEFVQEEIEHVREGKHGARSPQQAIAIGLSKARRAGIPLAPPSPGKTKRATRVSAERDYRKGQAGTTKKVSAKRSRATEAALKKEPRSTVSHKALSAHAKKAAKAR